MNSNLISLLVPTLVLVSGVVDDLRARKVHNWLILTLLVLTISSMFYLGGFSALQTGGVSLLVALGCCLPLVFTKILGAGDMKLLMVFGIAVDPMTIFWVLVYSFFWGGLLGVFQAILKKDGLVLLKNTFSILQGGQSFDKSKLHKVPFTVALLFGWLTQLSMTGFGGLLR